MFLRRKPANAFSRIDLLRDLRTAGIEPGDVLIVHSSMKRIGLVAGGIEEMLGALRDAVGKAGTLVMPTFSFNLNVWAMPAFEPWSTASRTGALTEIFRRTVGTIRTCHPSHSVAAWGRNAADITEGPIDYEPLGAGSPLDRARQLGAKIILMGIGQTRNSTVHLAESLVGMPYLRVPFSVGARFETAFYFEAKGAPRKELWVSEIPGSSEGFAVLDPILLRSGVSKPVRIGNAESQVMDANSLCHKLSELLAENPTLLLDSDPADISRRRAEFMRDFSEKPVSA